MKNLLMWLFSSELFLIIQSQFTDVSIKLWKTEVDFVLISQTGS